MCDCVRVVGGWRLGVEGDFRSPLDTNSEPSTPESWLLVGAASGGWDGSIALLSWLAHYSPPAVQCRAS